MNRPRYNPHLKRKPDKLAPWHIFFERYPMFNSQPFKKWVLSGLIWQAEVLKGNKPPLGDREVDIAGVRVKFRVAAAGCADVLGAAIVRGFAEV